MKTPILEMLYNIRKENRIPFYMPGHKGGRLFGDGASLFSYDITEIEGADDLHRPKGAICEAQELAARAFGAKHTFFLVGGATAGIHAMISSVASEGEKILTSRAIHKSAVYALSHAGATAVFLNPRQGKDGCFAIHPDDLRKKFSEHPSVKAFYLTNPDYYGNSQNLAELVEIAHKAGVLVLVDEAHGAHFAFSDRLPQTAMAAGADMAVESAHKTLPALTGSAYLHIGNAAYTERVAEELRAFETSSPSYLMMASLDYARAYMEEHKEDLSRLLCDIEEIFGLSPSPKRDSTRLVFHPKNMTGQSMAAILRREYGIEPEMADYDCAVMIVTPGNTKEELLLLKRATDEIMAREGKKEPIEVHFPPERVLCLREARRKTGEWASLGDAAGRKAAGMVYLYPPGIPLLLPGEEISGEILSAISAYRAAGVEIVGIRNGKIEVFPLI